MMNEYPNVKTSELMDLVAARHSFPSEFVEKAETELHRRLEADKKVDVVSVDGTIRDLSYRLNIIEEALHSLSENF